MDCRYILIDRWGAKSEFFHEDELADLADSVDYFIEYTEAMARNNPGMKHHYSEEAKRYRALLQKLLDIRQSQEEQ